MPLPRQTILARASRLFAESGYERTSLKDVAQAVGLSKAAIYHYFATKQEIYEAIVETLLSELHDYVASQVDLQIDHPSRLKAFMMAHADYFERHYAEFITLLHGVSGIGNPQTPRQIEVRDRYEGLLRGLLAEGETAGAFSGCNVADTARAILSMLNWMSRWFDPKGPKRAAILAADFFEVFYCGLAPR